METARFETVADSINVYLQNAVKGNYSVMAI